MKIKLLALCLIALLLVTGVPVTAQQQTTTALYLPSVYHPSDDNISIHLTTPFNTYPNNTAGNLVARVYMPVGVSCSSIWISPTFDVPGISFFQYHGECYVDDNGNYYSTPFISIYYSPVTITSLVVYVEYGLGEQAILDFPSWWWSYSVP